MSSLFTLTHSIEDAFIRATLVYLVLLLVVRFLPKRNIGSVAPHDILILVVIGGLATNGVMGEGTTVLDFLLMTAFIVLWAVVMDWLDYRFAALRWLFRDGKTLLIDHGHIIREHLRQEMITEDEVRAALRKEGVEDLSQIKLAYLEADGHISVIRYEH